MTSCHMSFYMTTFSLKKKEKKRFAGPGITSKIKKSSKRKQHLHEKFLKNKNKQNQLEYKSYKHFFE